MQQPTFVIMPTHGGRSMVEKAVASVLAQDVPTHLVIVENGSTDGTAQFVQGLPSRRVTAMHYIPQKGVSYAWNRALEYVFDRLRAPYAFVVNSDVVLRPNTVRLLIADGGEFVTCVSSDDPKCVEPRLGAHADLFGMLFKMTPKPGYPLPDPKSKRPHPCFSAFFLHRSVWERIGPFDERFFAWASDGDFHVRMHHAGVNAYCIDLPFYHLASGTLKVVSAEERAYLIRQAERDRSAFEGKWGFRMGSERYYAEFGHGRPDDPGAARE